MAESPTRLARFTRHLRLATLLLSALFGAAWGWLSYARHWLFGQEPGPPALAAYPGDGDGRASLAVFGDTLLGDAAAPTLAKVGERGVLARVRSLFSLADVSVLNLEAPVTEAPLEGRAKEYRYRQSEAALDALAEAGADVLTLANNHTLDAGERGLFDTLKAASARGLLPLGAGADEAEARRFAVLTVDGLKVGLVSYYKPRLFYDLWLNWYAHGASPGVAELSPRNATRDLARLRAHGAQVILALPHWGTDYQAVEAAQGRQARWLIDAGADAIIGHGTHVPQGLSLISGKPVLFSVGNFVFGTPGHPSLRCGLAPVLTFDREGAVQLTVRALAVQNREVRFVPRPDQTGQCLAQFVQESQAQGAPVTLSGDQATWVR